MQTEEIKELAEALAKAQAEIEGARKGAENPHFRSKYADLGAVWDACREPLTKHGLSIIQQPRSADGKTYLVTRVMHSSGQWIEDDGFPLILTKEDMQGLGSATTYARRYGLMAAVGIAPEDDDGNAASAGRKATPVKGANRKTTPKQELQKPTEPTPEDRADTFVGEIIGKLDECRSQDDLDDLVADNTQKLQYLHDNFPAKHQEWKQAVEMTKKGWEAMGAAEDSENVLLAG